MAVREEEIVKKYLSQLVFDDKLTEDEKGKIKAVKEIINKKEDEKKAAKKEWDKFVKMLEEEAILLNKKLRGYKVYAQIKKSQSSDTIEAVSIVEIQLKPLNEFITNYIYVPFDFINFENKYVSINMEGKYNIEASYLMEEARKIIDSESFKKKCEEIGNISS